MFSGPDVTGQIRRWQKEVIPLSGIAVQGLLP